MALDYDEWKDNLKNGIVTDEMFSSALFSINKTALYHSKRENMFSCSKKHAVKAEKSRTSKEKCYAIKDKLLTALEPDGICRERGNFVLRRHFEDEDGFVDTLARCFCGGLIKESGKVNWDSKSIRYFDEITDTEEYRYFLHYEYFDHSYLSPLNYDTKAVEQYAKEHMLSISDIGPVKPRNVDISNLYSYDFCKKVADLIEAGTEITQTETGEFIKWAKQLYDDDDYDEKKDYQPTDEERSLNIENAINTWGYVLDNTIAESDQYKNYNILNIEDIVRHESKEIERHEKNFKYLLNEYLKSYSALPENITLPVLRDKRKKVKKLIRNIRETRDDLKHEYCSDELSILPIEEYMEIYDISGVSYMWFDVKNVNDLIQIMLDGADDIDMSSSWYLNSKQKDEYLEHVSKPLKDVFTGTEKEANRLCSEYTSRMNILKQEAKANNR